MRQGRLRARGFTLVELLTVVAIVGVMATLAMFSLTNSGGDQNASALARGIELAMLRARTEAMSDGSARQLRCGPSVSSASVGTTFAGCSFWAATVKGLSPPATAFVEEPDNIQAASHAYLWNVTGVVSDTATNAGVTPTTVNTSITFYPSGAATTGGNGTSSGATVFVCDKNKQHQYKVFVFGGTGLAKLVNTW